MDAPFKPARTRPTDPESHLNPTRRTDRRTVLQGLAGVVGVTAFGLHSAAGAAATPGEDPWLAPVRELTAAHPRELFGIDFGARDLTAGEVLTYVRALAESSDRVRSGELHRQSVQGRSLSWLMVGHPDNIAGPGLRKITKAAHELRSASTPKGRVRAVARDTPAIVFLTGNIHGDEKSGTDASLRMAWELATRNDAAARRILDRTVIVIVPTVNPDGREEGIRRNGARFDLNRDWAARTQPETDAVMELARRFPPVVFLDAHEMTQRDTFWIPPYGDPIHHEVPAHAIDAVNEHYGPNIAEAFEARGIPYLTEEPYDSFYVGKSSTTTTMTFGSTGILTEKQKNQSAEVRVEEHFVALWSVVSTAAAQKSQAQQDVHAGHIEAVRQGEAGQLKDNEVWLEGNEVQVPVPDRLVRHYFLTEDRSHAREMHQLVRRLQRLDVTVYRLKKPLNLTDFRAWGREPEATRLPAGTYWIPMAQERKHLIQGLLGESTYPAVPVFYDIAGWNQALFLNLEGGSSGQWLQGNPNKYGTVVRDLGPTPEPPRPRAVPRMAVWLDDRFNYTTQSVGWFRHTWTEHWGLPGDSLSVIDHTDIRAGRLSEFDVLVIPEGASSSGLRLLDRSDPDDAATEDGIGTAAMGDLVHRGGTLIAWRQAARLVSRAGIGTTDYDQPDIDIPGSLLRLRVDQESPLAEGVGPFVWAQNENDHVLVPGEGVAVPVSYPALDHEDFFVSGWAAETEGIGGTAAVTDEQVGAGRVVLFAFDVTFRAMAEGTARLLWNVLFGADGKSADGKSTDAKVAGQAAGRLPVRDRPVRARAGAPERDGAAPMILSVPADSASAARTVVRSMTDPLGLAVEESTRGKVHRFYVANPHELDEEGHPFAHELPGALRTAGVRIRSLSLPS